MAVELRSPYLLDGFRWLKGNLHTHTTASDGRMAPAEAAQAYAALGHDFLGIADHDVALTAADAQAIGSLLIIPCVEVTANGPHVLAIGIAEPVTPSPDRQAVIDAIAHLGGLSVLNHPNWGFDEPHFSDAAIAALRGYAGIEVFNGIVDFLEGSAVATDRWNRILSRRSDVWGFGSDDAHGRVHVGQAWNVVQARDVTVEAVVDGLRHGRFYASTGVTIESVTVDGPRLSVVAPDAQRIVFRGVWGRMLHACDAAEAAYVAAGSEGGFVRVECIGAGGRTAWTQPVVVAAP